MTSLWEPIPLGSYEDSGQRMNLSLVTRNLLVGGLPGSGKSALLDICIAAGAVDRNCDLCLIDPKKVEHAGWAPLARWHVAGPDLDLMERVLTVIREGVDSRTDDLVRQRRRNIHPSDGGRLVLVVVDELAEVVKSKKAAELLRSIVSLGRAVGIVVVAATQRPSHTVIPTDLRDLFQYRWAGRCTTDAMSDMILGPGWAAEGFSGKAVSDRTPGVGWLLAEETAPRLIRCDYVSDEMRGRMQDECLRRRPQHHARSLA